MKRSCLSWLAACLALLCVCSACTATTPPAESPTDTSEAESTPLASADFRSIKTAIGGNGFFYMNDLGLGGTADPTVLAVEENGKTCFYMYCTGIHGYYSYDLMSWIKMDNVFPKPTNSWSKADYWAPEIFYDAEAGLYRLFYSASSAEGYFYLGMATSESPRGPFVPWTGTNADGLKIEGKTPLYDFSRMDKTHPLYEGVIRAIDVFPYVDPVSGNKYLYWVRGWNEGGTVKHTTSEIWVVQMKDWTTPDYDTVTRLTEVAKVTVGGEKTKHTEQSINEGPAVLYREGKYYLTFSVNPASYKGYSVWQAVADSPTGPFTKLERDEGGLVLGVDSPWTHMSGTGHHCFFTVGDELYIGYHAHEKREYTTMGERAFACDRVVWRENADGLTVLHANGPTWSPQPLPSAVSGYTNVAPTATLRGVGEADAALLCDGVINMHERDGAPEAIFTSETTLTYTWDTPQAVRSVLVYTSPKLANALTGAVRMEIDTTDADGNAVTLAIENPEFFAESYTGGNPGTEYMRPGAALVVRLEDDTPVSALRITLTPSDSGTLAVPEIYVMARSE